MVFEAEHWAHAPVPMQAGLADEGQARLAAVPLSPLHAAQVPLDVLQAGVVPVQALRFVDEH